MIRFPFLFFLSRAVCANVHDHNFPPAPLLLPADIFILRFSMRNTPGTYYLNLTLIHITFIH